MIIKETSTGYQKGKKYEVNSNMKSNFHLKEESNITQVKRRIDKFGFKVKNENKNGKGENIFMFTETPENQNKVIPNTFEYEITKENPNNKMDYELLLKIMNTIIDTSIGTKPKTYIADVLGITPNIFKNYINFLKKINFINCSKNQKYYWYVDFKNFKVRPAQEQEFTQFFNVLKETKDFAKTKEMLEYFCYSTTQYGINTEHKLIKYTNLENITQEIIEKFEKEFGVGFEF
jgi:hypothetical protein